MKKLLTLFAFLAFSYTMVSAQTVRVDTLSAAQLEQRFKDSIYNKTTVNSITQKNIATRLMELARFTGVQRDSIYAAIALDLMNYYTRAQDSLLLDAKANKVDSNQAYYNAKRLQGVWLSPLAPNNGQVILYNGIYAYWGNLPATQLDSVLAKGNTASKAIRSSASMTVDTINSRTAHSHYQLVNGDSLMTATDSAIYYGTSVTVGQGATSNSLGYAYISADAIGVTCIDSGIAGSHLVESSPGDGSMEDRLPKLPPYRSTIRYISFEYGINDNTDTATFRLKYSMILDTVLAKGWPASKIVVLTPTPRVSNLSTEALYAAVIKSVCTVRNISVVDEYTFLLGYGTNNILGLDSTHPTNYGHNLAGSYFYDQVTLKKNPRATFWGNIVANKKIKSVAYLNATTLDIQEPVYNSVGQTFTILRSWPVSGTDTLYIDEVVQASNHKLYRLRFNQTVFQTWSSVDSSNNLSKAYLTGNTTLNPTAVGTPFASLISPSYSSVGNANYLWFVGAGTVDSFAIKIEAIAGSKRKVSWIFRSGGTDTYITSYTDDGSAAFAKYNGDALAGNGLLTVVASANVSQSGVNTLTSYAGGSADGTYVLSVELNVASLVTNTFKVQVAWTDENNVGQTMDWVPNMALASGTTTIPSSATISTAGNYAFPNISIRAKASTSITIKTTAVVGGGSMSIKSSAMIMHGG